MTLSSIALAVSLAASSVSGMTLDSIYGGMAAGCTYDQEANYKVITAYVDEKPDAKPVLSRPDGGKKLAPVFGKARFEDMGESFQLHIPILHGGTLYGMPVSKLMIYRGSGIAGVTVTFPKPMADVRAGLQKAKVTLRAHDHGWGPIEPVLESTPDQKSTELSCDLSM